MSDIINLINYIWSNNYLKALAIFILSYIAMQLTLFISEKIFLKLTKKTETVIDDLIVEKTRKPLALFLLVLGARFALESLQFSPQKSYIIEGVFNTALVIIATYVVAKVFNIFTDNWAKQIINKSGNNISNDLFSIIHRLTNAVIFFIGFIYILKLWGVEIGPLITSLGIAGIAIAFALQSTLGNIFGGASLIVDKAFKVGDIVELDDTTVGTVDKVSLRSTKIKTFDNELITIPNGKLADSKIKNWNAIENKLRLKVSFSVAYGSDIDKIRGLIMAILKNEKNILKDPEPCVIFLEMGDFALQFSARFWIKRIEDKVMMKDKVTTAIYNTLRQNNIDIPYPTQSIIIKK